MADPMILIDTQCATDNGEWIRAKVIEYPDAHVIGYAGDMDQFCAVEDAMRRAMTNPSRFGLRCAHLGELATDKIGKEDAIEPPILLPPRFAGIRVRNLEHMNEVVQAFKLKGPLTFVVWLADRDNQQLNMEIAPVALEPVAEEEVTVH